MLAKTLLYASLWPSQNVALSESDATLFCSACNWPVALTLIVELSVEEYDTSACRSEALTVST